MDLWSGERDRESGQSLYSKRLWQQRVPAKRLQATHSKVAMELDTLTTGSVGAGSRVVAPPAIAEPLLEAGRREVNALARTEMSALVPLTRDEEAAAEPETASAGVPSALTAAGAAARPMSSCAIALQEPRTNSRVSQPSWTGSAHRCQCELCACQYVGSDTHLFQCSATIKQELPEDALAGSIGDIGVGFQNGTECIVGSLLK